MIEIQDYYIVCCLKKLKMYVKMSYYILVHKICKSKNCIMPNTKYLWEYYEKGISYIAGGIVNWYNLFSESNLAMCFKDHKNVHTL